jgi:sulfhydrogenase subunit beta (sulfur reductase)
MTGPEEQKVIAAGELNRLISALVKRDYNVIGPVVRDGAIVYDSIESIDDLPAGWSDEQERGFYRLKRRDNGALFGYASSPQSWKKFLHPANIRLWSAQRENGTFRILDQAAPPKKRYAFLGVRACDLAAIGGQDRVLIEDLHRDPVYAGRRDGAFIVAVECTQSSRTCFCASMNTGPHARAGYDLALTELLDDRGHRFVIRAGTEAGREVLVELAHAEADEEDHERANAAVNNAASTQVRRMDTTNIRELLYSNFDHPRWDDVATRCLACTNCTLVCPTCFCTTVEDTSDLSGDRAERWRRLDSCFTLDFS